MTLQLPSHVQTNLNKEARLLQRNLVDLEKETRQRMRCIAQDQQIASTKLRSLQIRLQASQKKFHSLIHHEEENDDTQVEDDRRDSMSTCIFARKASNYLNVMQLAPMMRERETEDMAKGHSVGLQAREGLQESVTGERRRGSEGRRGSRTGEGVQGRRGSVTGEARRGSVTGEGRRGSVIGEGRRWSGTGEARRGSVTGEKYKTVSFTDHTVS